MIWCFLLNPDIYDIENSEKKSSLFLFAFQEKNIVILSNSYYLKNKLSKHFKNLIAIINRNT
jgi:hypothetical protein